jgi:hypothetical protein
VLRRAYAAVAALSLFTIAAPADAQFFLRSRDITGQPVRGDEADLGAPLPGATPAELSASVVWNFRAALNVAALQCSRFAPTLLTLQNYNAILTDHADELDKTYKALNGYFVRTAKTKAAGDKAFNAYITELYSHFTTVALAQYGFCAAAGPIGREARMIDRGQLARFASEKLREMHNSMVPFYGTVFGQFALQPQPLPRLDPQCWTKRDEWDAKACGPWRDGLSAR